VLLLLQHQLLCMHTAVGWVKAPQVQLHTPLVHVNAHASRLDKSPCSDITLRGLITDGTMPPSQLRPAWSVLNMSQS
jgi:hypothetical protein